MKLHSCQLLLWAQGRTLSTCLSLAFVPPCCLHPHGIHSFPCIFLFFRRKQKTNQRAKNTGTNLILSYVSSGDPQTLPPEFPTPLSEGSTGMNNNFSNNSCLLSTYFVLGMVLSVLQALFPSLQVRSVCSKILRPGVFPKSVF